MKKTWAATLLILFAACGKPAEKPKASPADRKKLGQVPEFVLEERTGEMVGRKTLKGRVWIASFIFTRCKSICVTMCAEMRKLQDEFGDEPDFRIVSTTVDPAYDSADVLAEFARTQGAKGDRWLFLTGEKDKIKEFAYGGLKVPGDPEAIIIHSDYFVLIDRDGTIRGYYKQREPGRMAKLREDISAVLAEKRQP